MEEGRAVCPGEELTYTCSIIHDTIKYYQQTVWSGLNCSLLVLHGPAELEPETCGSFSAQATGSDGGCYTSTLTVTSSLELNGTVIQCHSSTIVGSTSLFLQGYDYDVYYYYKTKLTLIINITGPPSPIPTQNPSTDTLTSTTIEWSVPGDSGADITSYTITYTSESGEGMESVDVSATSALLTGLIPNVDYEASITASNCAGTSEPTAFSFRILGTGES